MKNRLIELIVKAQAGLAQLREEEGQDLIEYALIVALIAFAATAGMKSLSGGLNTAFQNISNILATYIS